MFETQFRALTGHAPFPWQEALFHSLVAGEIPCAVDLPTGLGKTSVIALWLLALAESARCGSTSGFPRRLAYVVNRRTVVDQASAEARSLLEALDTHADLREARSALLRLCVDPSGGPVAVSTLRGELADNGAWRQDPARASLVVGTVDMIGSRLLFSGYGCGFRSRPLHAGFLGQDCLLVHDEAHLEPAFQRLIEALVREQAGRDPRPLQVMALTATQLGSGSAVFRLGTRDLEDPVVLQRVAARKGLAFHDAGDDLVATVARVAWEHEASDAAVLVFLRRVEDAEKVAAVLGRRARGRVQTLTGTMRGWERDRLTDSDPVFGRFRSDPPEEVRQGTVYLVCTSAGEVGVNISADHMVCDLSTFESMAQRLGRVNRFGNPEGAPGALVDVAVEPQAAGDAESHPLDAARARTEALLRCLPLRADGRHDASPAALSDLPEEERLAAFAPVPVCPLAPPELLDAWAMTTARSLPNRPAVAPWLHGLAPWEPPATRVAWRSEVETLAPGILSAHAPADLLDEYPVKPHEVMELRSDRAWKQLERLARRCPDAPVWVVADDSVWTGRCEELDRKCLDGALVLLPPSAGGLSPTGQLAGEHEREAELDYDVADLWGGSHGRRRIRLWDDAEPPRGMRLVRSIDTWFDASDPPEPADGEPVHRDWRWYCLPASADDDGSLSARQPQALDDHLRATETAARRIVAGLGLGGVEVEAVVAAARWHDLGKRRPVWQRSIGNLEFPAVILAKSGSRARPVDLGRYRHELGSLADLAAEDGLAELSAAGRDLALHLIAAHHGRARPHFPQEEAFDPGTSAAGARRIVAEVPRRFGRLQQRYGRWGLAWLESLVRAADALASQGVGAVVRESTAAQAGVEAR